LGIKRDLAAKVLHLLLKKGEMSQDEEKLKVLMFFSILKYIS
jgi:hypothetical protein